MLEDTLRDRSGKTATTHGGFQHLPGHWGSSLLKTGPGKGIHLQDTVQIHSSKTASHWLCVDSHGRSGQEQGWNQQESQRNVGKQAHFG